mgnify:CR=1 FL=1
MYIEEFRSKVGWFIYWAVRQKFETKVNQETINLSWNKKDGYAEVTVFISMNDAIVIDGLNGDTELKLKVSDALKVIYRYTGEFQFAVDDIPF